MTKMLLSLVVLLACSLPTMAQDPAVPVPAKKYFRPMDPAHIQQDAIGLYAVRDRSFLGGVTDIALLTHSSKDGSIIPERLQEWIAPENWVPLQIGFGGDITKNALMHVGASYNVGGQLAHFIVKATGSSETGVGKGINQVFQDGLTLPNGSNIGFALGLGLAASVVKEGHFQSVMAMFPGQGLGPILTGASCYSLGARWTY